MEEINIGDSDEKADWIKLVDGGKHQAADLAASDEALKQLQAEAAAAKKKPKKPKAKK